MHDLTACTKTPSINMTGFDPLGVGVHRASTIVFDNAEAYSNRGARGDDGYSYGLYGTPTTRTLEAKLTILEGAVRCFLTPSGQAANTLAMLPFLSSGDKVLIVDTAYPPTRDFADRDLTRMGVKVEFFDPQSLSDLERRIDANTKMVWCETPGSTTMEVQDLPSVSAIAKQVGALVGCDNTWATPLNYKPHLHGADIVTEALTKYVSGHSDVLMGSISTNRHDLVEPIKSFIGRMGIGVSADDASLVLRGFETLGVRLKYSSDVAGKLMLQAAEHHMVDSVLHPSLPGNAGHEIWKRDFAGGSAVFGITFKPSAVPHVMEAIDAFEHFAIGASWGGTRSLVAPMPVKANRTASEWQAEDLVLRVSVGLEHEDDLSGDFVKFFSALECALEECAA